MKRIAEVQSKRKAVIIGSGECSMRRCGNLSRVVNVSYLPPGDSAARGDQAKSSLSSVGEMRVKRGKASL